MNKIVVLGDGILGSEIVKQTKWDYISRKKDGFDINNCDFQKLNEYDIIINCIANTDTYDYDKKSHWNTNYASVYKLALYCNTINAKLVHISSDFVYANSFLNGRKEIDAPSPFPNWYSLTKLLADNVIELVSENYLICRTTHIQYPFPHSKAFPSRQGNFDYVNKIAELIIKLIDKKARGLYNVGTEFKNMYQLAQETKPDVKCAFMDGFYPKETRMDLIKLEDFLFQHR